MHTCLHTCRDIYLGPEPREHSLLLTPALQLLHTRTVARSLRPPLLWTAVIGLLEQPLLVGLCYLPPKGSSAALQTPTCGGQAQAGSKRAAATAQGHTILASDLTTPTPQPTPTGMRIVSWTVCPAAALTVPGSTATAVALIVQHKQAAPVQRPLRPQQQCSHQLWV